MFLYFNIEESRVIFLIDGYVALVLNSLSFEYFVCSHKPTYRDVPASDGKISIRIEHQLDDLLDVGIRLNDNNLLLGHRLQGLIRLALLQDVEELILYLKVSKFGSEQQLFFFFHFFAISLLLFIFPLFVISLLLLLRLLHGLLINNKSINIHADYNSRVLL